MKVVLIAAIPDEEERIIEFVRRDRRASTTSSSPAASVERRDDITRESIRARSPSSRRSCRRLADDLRARSGRARLCGAVGGAPRQCSTEEPARRAGFLIGNCWVPGLRRDGGDVRAVRGGCARPIRSKSENAKSGRASRRSRPHRGNDDRALTLVSSYPTFKGNGRSSRSSSSRPIWPSSTRPWPSSTARLDR